MAGGGFKRPRNWARIRLLVLERDQYRCWLCGSDNPPANSVDHVVPRARGGNHSLDNLRASHAICNSRRGARPVLPMAKVSGRWSA